MHIHLCFHTIQQLHCIHLKIATIWTAHDTCTMIFHGHCMHIQQQNYKSCKYTKVELKRANLKFVEVFLFAQSIRALSLISVAHFEPFLDCYLARRAMEKWQKLSPWCKGPYLSIPLQEHLKIFSRTHGELHNIGITKKGWASLLQRGLLVWRETKCTEWLEL